MRVESHLRVDRDVLLVTASYGITSLRLLFAGFGAAAILGGGDLWFASSMIALIMASDYFDGVIFAKSRFSEIRNWRINRRFADSVADRLVIQIICIPLSLRNPSFTWLYLPIVVREIAISGYLSKQFARGLIVYPRSVAKLACAGVGTAVISFLLLPFRFTLMTTAVMIVLSAFALLDYVRRARDHKTSISPIEKPIGSLDEIF